MKHTGSAQVMIHCVFGRKRKPKFMIMLALLLINIQCRQSSPGTLKEETGRTTLGNQSMDSATTQNRGKTQEQNLKNKIREVLFQSQILSRNTFDRFEIETTRESDLFPGERFLFVHAFPHHYPWRVFTILESTDDGPVLITRDNINAIFEKLMRTHHVTFHTEEIVESFLSIYLEVYYCRYLICLCPQSYIESAGIKKYIMILESFEDIPFVDHNERKKLAQELKGRIAAPDLAFFPHELSLNFTVWYCFGTIDEWRIDYKGGELETNVVTLASTYLCYHIK